MTTRGGLHRDRAARTLYAMNRSGAGGRRRTQPTRSSRKIQEKWMKLVKTSAIACALAALIATPVFAQGTSSGIKPGGTVQSKPMQGGASVGEDEDLATQPGAAGEKTGMKSTKGTKGTVGTTGSAAHKGTVDDSASGSPATGKRY
ncbi:bll7487 [Bradyrhizobium diazoefficiens USDA 110]|jgi:hypothetical protein|uniref:Bll7487 protein n=1 Tax=Bradyrhizobium diazoefficiens (strain JCM 10833 / BCRC 13528 / IAM 13628 / NBRC 14792 / USDA 110) TaxID=224911 RepID=Q89DF2_BRADU|nr:hypothetical protein CO678_31950 [Bradyrhizobium diazoefficiens]QBP26229.1 hypothetical protein Bdiaspc4_39505 [Bradyrhizobium diazoefficiens]BAC52752.1 bll7487 [Bradyrhizobium diazoefficiens USDA 110]